MCTERLTQQKRLFTFIIDIGDSRVLDYIIRFIVTILIIAGIAFILPTLVIFFLQVAITACVFFVIVFILSLFYKGDKNDT